MSWVFVHYYRKKPGDLGADLFPHDLDNGDVAAIIKKKLDDYPRKAGQRRQLAPRRAEVRDLNDQIVLTAYLGEDGTFFVEPLRNFSGSQ